jgi:F0F1-type ATP synthase membrane subunit b/b'
MPDRGDDRSIGGHTWGTEKVPSAHAENLQERIDEAQEHLDKAAQSVQEAEEEVREARRALDDTGERE